MPYDELINRLRECTAEQNGEKTLWHQAADAIERLDAIAQTYVETVHEIEDKRKWIPVTERLPEDRQKVLALELPYGKSSRYYYSIVYFSTNLEKVDEYDFQGKNRSGFYSLDSEYGWCEHCAVVYWMPLPPLPDHIGDATEMVEKESEG